ncbi:hypothetical protein ACFBZI_10560 [Moraxella sp. ZJ142]|uniref:hypothetical protein n=1 Tax=Moraxella marmotae TaxID=3344520 RepID=UPI0035D48728
MNYTNNANIPLPLAVFLATDTYDGLPNSISATTLLKPIRQIILSQRLDNEATFTDVADLVSSRMGSAIHTAIEQAWLNPTNALRALGYSQKVIDKIKVNPTNPNPDDINIYMEQRSCKDIAGMTVTGKFDFVAEGQVQDFKSTSVWTYLNQSNAEKYQLQGSIYRWLNPRIIHKDYMTIHYIFTDFNKVESLRNKDYPPNRVHSQRIPLLDLDATEHYVRTKIKQIISHKDTPECDLPQCTDADLWRKPTVYKYYKDPNKLDRSTKNFDNFTDAAAYMATKYHNNGMIKEVKGQVVACRYCPALTLCTQKDAYLASGELIL